MESEKQFKEENNSLIKSRENELEMDPSFAQFESQFDFGPQTENLLKTNVGQQAVENIKRMFNKTETVRRVADVKHQQIQAQFKELRQRLNSSSECLLRTKKGLDNIKFSYQHKLFEMQRTLTAPAGDHRDAISTRPQTKEEVAKQMDEIRDKIKKIQSHVHDEKAKQEKVMESYKDAFENVSAVLESIDRGDYSSINLTEAAERK